MNHLDEKIAQLNPAQKEVVEHSHLHQGALLVLAGAGSGKTTVLTLRVVKQIEEGVDPIGIFCISFTVKSAAEMKERMTKLLSLKSRHPWMGTFHSLAFQILKSSDLGSANWVKLGLSSEPKIWEEGEWALELGQRIHQHPLLAEVVFREHIECLAHSLDYTCPPNLSPEYWPELLQTIQNMGQEFNKIRFNEMLLWVIDLFQKDANLLALWQSRVQYLLVDEYQDIDPIQYQFCKLLLGDNQNFVAVGDDDQAIYGFRGADPTCILRFKEDFPLAHLIKLEENYRSHPQILKLANRIFQDKESSYRKVLYSGKSWNSSPKCQVLSPKFKHGTHECTWLAKEIAELISIGYNAFDLVLLCRFNRQVQYYQAALQYYGIPLMSEENQGVQVLTLHASKGLEFPVVFYMGLSEGLSPDKDGDPAEEKRLFYVGVTRAIDRLYLIHSTQRVYRDKLQSFKPSPFLKYFKKGFFSSLFGF